MCNKFAKHVVIDLSDFVKIIENCLKRSKIYYMSLIFYYGFRNFMKW